MSMLAKIFLPNNAMRRCPYLVGILSTTLDLIMSAEVCYVIIDLFGRIDL